MIIDYLNDKITISLEDFIITFLKKWKMTAVIVILCAGLFAGVSYAIGEEISAPASEEYLYWEENLKNVVSYRENSILMEADPMKIYQETIFLSDIADKEILKNYVFSTEIWNELETDRSKLYASELIEWVESETSNLVTLNLRHATEEECKIWMTYLCEQIVEFDVDVKVTKGSASIVTDEKVLERQQKKYDDIGFAEQLLDESQAAYTIEVRIEVAAMLGAVMGGIVSGLLVAVGMMFKKNSRG